MSHYSSLRSAHAHASDSTLIRQVREGRTEGFRDLYRRHYPAVSAYTAMCIQSPSDIYELTCQAFADLLRNVQSGEFSHRFPGCLRLELLTSVRRAAVIQSAENSSKASPRFRQWVEQGARWPMVENGQLALAWGALPPDTKCLLWHTTPDLDDAGLVSRMTGIHSSRITHARTEALTALRRARAELYLERLGRPDCLDAVDRLMSDLPHPENMKPFAHLDMCETCRELFNDVSRLDAQLRTHLPGQLLGWWPGNAYLRAKAATPVPTADPPFLTRTAPTAHAVPEPQPTADRRRGAQALRPRTIVALSAFAVGIAIGYGVHSTAVPQQAGQQMSGIPGLGPCPAED